MTQKSNPIVNLAENVRHAATILRMYDAHHPLLASADLFNGCMSEQLWQRFHNTYTSPHSDDPATAVVNYLTALQNAVVETQGVIQDQVEAQALLKLEALVANYYRR